jgi:hypothetical protein
MVISKAMKTTTFMDLPQEIHDLIFKEVLAIPRHAHWKGSGLHVRFARFESPPIDRTKTPCGQHCPCRKLPLALLATCTRTRAAALRILLQSNRLVFEGHPQDHLSFLRHLGSAILYIRNLDFALYPENLEFQDLHPWKELIAYLQNLNLSQLTLSIDTAPCDMTYDNPECFRDDWKTVLEQYTRFIEMFKDLGTQGLKDFHVYLLAYGNYESEFESRVMGPQYKSSRIHHNERFLDYPHGDHPPDQTPSPPGVWNIWDKEQLSRRYRLRRGPVIH